MIRRILLTILFLSLSQYLFAQKQGLHLIDSLLAELLKAKEDTNMINLFSQLSYHYARINPETGIEYGNKGIALAEKLHWKKGYVKVLNSMGANYLKVTDNISAEKCYIRAMQMCEEIGDRLGTATNLENIGRVYQARSNYPVALEYHLKALGLNEGLENKQGIATNTSSIGNVYYYQADYPRALDYYIKSLKLNEELGNKKGIASNTANAGVIYRVQDNYPKALEYYFKALKINEEINDKGGMSSNTRFIGIVYMLQDDYSNALEYYLKALKLNEAAGNKRGIVITTGDIGNNYLKSGKHTEAESYLRIALQLAEEIGASDFVREFNKNLSMLYSQKQDWEQAYNYYKGYITVKDSLFNEETAKKSLRLAMNYEFSKKEDSLKFRQQLLEEQLEKQKLLSLHHQQELLLRQQELSLAEKGKELQYLEFLRAQAELASEQSKRNENEKQLAVVAKEKKLLQTQNELARINAEKNRSIASAKLQRQRIYLWSGSGFALLILAFSVINFRKNKKLALERLRNKISRDLHDEVGSTLSSISLMNEMAKRNTDEEVIRTHIANNIESAQNAMSEIVWLLNPKNDELDNFILRLGEVAKEMLDLKGIGYRLIIPEELKKANIAMEKRREIFLIFKECLNNIIKYADCTEVAVELNYGNKALTIIVSDNGRGFDPSIITSGNGLHNMKGRATALNGTLKIETAPGKGTNVELAVPFA